MVAHHARTEPAPLPAFKQSFFFWLGGGVFAHYRHAARHAPVAATWDNVTPRFCRRRATYGAAPQRTQHVHHFAAPTDKRMANH